MFFGPPARLGYSESRRTLRLILSRSFRTTSEEEGIFGGKEAPRGYPGWRPFLVLAEFALDSKLGFGLVIRVPPRPVVG